jgi:hypothetical protein
MFYGHADLVKVKSSMARLLTVVNERKKLRNEYRQILEDQYIAKMKGEEKVKETDRIEKARENKESFEMTEDEIKEKLKKK